MFLINFQGKLAVFSSNFNHFMAKYQRKLMKKRQNLINLTQNKVFLTPRVHQPVHIDGNIRGVPGDFFLWARIVTNLAQFD